MRNILKALNGRLKITHLYYEIMKNSLIDKIEKESGTQKWIKSRIVGILFN